MMQEEKWKLMMPNGMPGGCISTPEGDIGEPGEDEGGSATH